MNALSNLTLFNLLRRSHNFSGQRLITRPLSHSHTCSTEQACLCSLESVHECIPLLLCFTQTGETQSARFPGSHSAMIHFINLIVKNGKFHADTKNSTSNDYDKYLVLLFIVMTLNHGDSCFNAKLLLCSIFCLTKVIFTAN